VEYYFLLERTLDIIRREISSGSHGIPLKIPCLNDKTLKDRAETFEWWQSDFQSYYSTNREFQLK